MKKQWFLSFLLAGLFAGSLLAYGQSWAGVGNPTLTQTYDIAPQACEGLDLDGVTYSFTVAGAPSGDCIAGTIIGPGSTNNIEAPNIEGTSAGTLHLTFDVPTTKFGFGAALNTFDSPQNQSVIVHLNRPGIGLLREEVLLDATSDPNFVGGRFDYNGPAVKTLTIQFSSGSFVRFAVDNVTYFLPPGRRHR